MTRRIRTTGQARRARAVVSGRRAYVLSARDTPKAIAIRDLAEHYRHEIDHMFDDPPSSEMKEAP